MCGRSRVRQLQAIPVYTSDAEIRAASVETEWGNRAVEQGGRAGRWKWGGGGGKAVVLVSGIRRWDWRVGLVGGTRRWSWKWGWAVWDDRWGWAVWQGSRNRPVETGQCGRAIETGGRARLWSREVGLDGRKRSVGQEQGSRNKAVSKSNHKLETPRIP